MADIYIDPTVSSGGSGSQVNPYSLAEGVAAINALSGDRADQSIFFRSGTFGVVETPIVMSCYNYNFGHYGSGAQPILCATNLKTGTWTQYSGNTWTIGATRWDALFLGGMTSNGLIASSQAHSLPCGLRLTPVDTIAHCQATSMSQFWDGASTMYVNLGGLDPRNEVITTSNLAVLYTHSGAQPAGILIDGVEFANAFDGNLWLNFAVGASGVVLTDVITRNAMAQGVLSMGGPTIRTNLQIIGNSTANPVDGVVLERVESYNSMLEGIDLLFCRAPIIHDFTIDGCLLGLSFWNDVTDARVSKGTISNGFACSPYWYSFPDYVTGYKPAAVKVHNQGSGNDGNSYRNRFNGLQLVNNGGAGFFLHTGSSNAIENCTVYQTSTQTADFGPTNANGGNNTCVSIMQNGDETSYGMSANIDCVLSNNIFIQDGGQPLGYPRVTIHVGFPGVTPTPSVKGDNNIYYHTDGSAGNYYLGSNGYTDFASWKVAASAVGLDANSVSFNVARSALPFKNVGTFTANPYSSSLGSNYLSGFDLTPLNAEDGDSDSTPIRFADPIWVGTDTSPTLVAGDLTDTAAGALAATTYYVKTTWVGTHGETLPSDEVSRAVTINRVLNVAAPGSPPSWATGWNVYVGTATGVLWKQNAYPIGTATPWVEPAAGLLSTTHGVKPPTVKPNNGPNEDANGEPFLSHVAPDCGGVQHRHLTHPARTRQTGNGW